jgi:hypothetical protein
MHNDGMCRKDARSGGLHERSGASCGGRSAAVRREKGQVENQVGLVRERFFTPRLRFKTYEDLNGWLLDQCVAYAQAHWHPEFRDQTI